MRNALLSSVSHDLRTPLAAIMGAASVLKEEGNSVTADVTHELAQSIYGEADRLNRFLLNLLDMTRLEAGAIDIRRDNVDVGETVMGAIERVRKTFPSRQVAVHLPERLPPFRGDAALLEPLRQRARDDQAILGHHGTGLDVAGGGLQVAQGAVEGLGTGHRLPRWGWARAAVARTDPTHPAAVIAIRTNPEPDG